MAKFSAYRKAKMPKLEIRNSLGFTLVEILVAIIILSFGILAVSQMTVMGMRVNTVVNKRMHGRAVLAQVFEDLNNLPSNAPELQDPDGPGDLDDDSLGDYSKTVTDPANRHTYQVRWNIADNIPELDMKTVRIHVLWGPTDGWKLTTNLIKSM